MENEIMHHSERAFEAEFTAPAKPAIDVPVPPPMLDPESVSSFDNPDHGASAPDPEIPLPPPMFSEVEEPVPPTDPKPEPEKVLTKKQIDAKLSLFIKARDVIQSRMLAKLAKTEDTSLFKYNSEEIDMLAEAYAPYMEKYGGHIPAWLELAIVEMMILGGKIITAINIRKVNLENEKLREELPENIVSSVGNAGGRERTRWQIDGNGFYLYDLFGTYLRAEDRKEKASLSDIQTIMAKNGASVVKKAFGLDKLPDRDAG